MKIIPMDDRVQVKVIIDDDDDVKKSGAIFIPEKQQDASIKAIVVATGENSTLLNGKKKEMPVKAGDKVIIGKYAGYEIKIEDEEFLFVRPGEILGIINE